MAIPAFLAATLVLVVFLRSDPLQWPAPRRCRPTSLPSPVAGVSWWALPGDRVAGAGRLGYGTTRTLIDGRRAYGPAQARRKHD